MSAQGRVAGGRYLQTAMHVQNKRTYLSQWCSNHSRKRRKPSHLPSDIARPCFSTCKSPPEIERAASGTC
jgi:hypothetical protein